MELPNLSGEELTEFMTRRYLDSVLKGQFIEAAPLADAIHKHYQHPMLASHLVSSRGFYTHHGLYVGNGEVIHYSGLSDGLSAGPVNRVSLEEFCNGNGYSIRYHKNKMNTPEVIIARAESRLDEKSYNLIFNNCEHFVNWCIHGISGSEQVDTVLKYGTKGLRAVKVVSNSTPAAAMAVSALECRKSMTAFLKGDINGDKLLEDVSGAAISTASMAYYAGLGQVAIPVPVLGALVGAGVGLFVGKTLQQSGYLALGEAPAVSEARQRRQEIEKLCERLIPSIQASREALEKQLDLHFGEKSKALIASFDHMDNAVEEGDSAAYVNALESVASEMNVMLQFGDFAEFKVFMKSSEPFEL